MQKNLPTLAVLLPLMMLSLAACASRTSGTDLGTLTGSSDAACITIDPISPNRGKPGGATTEDISAALDRDHPVERVRNLVGDTDPTLKQVDKNNAARKALCEGANAGGH